MYKYEIILYLCLCVIFFKKDAYKCKKIIILFTNIKITLYEYVKNIKYCHGFYAMFYRYVDT